MNDIQITLRQRCLDFFESEEVWIKIQAAYSETHRYYHTLLHLHRMFVCLDKLDDIPYKSSIELAIWFHDLVYNTSKDSYSGNEANSVSQMLVIVLDNPAIWTKVDGDHSIVSIASSFILDTKKHKPELSWYMEDDDMMLAAKYFLDIDLSILGEDDLICEKFDNDIRLEFQQYDDQEFSSGRVDALTSFKNRDSIYFTDYFKDELEMISQRNLSRLIGKWQQGTI